MKRFNIFLIMIMTFGLYTDNANANTSGEYFNTVINTISIEDSPFDIGISDGYAYVVSEVGNSVSVIRLSDEELVKTIPVGNGPLDIEIADGYAYVANNVDNSVSVIRLLDWVVVKTIPVGDGPRDIEIADGYAYVAGSSGYMNNSSISVIRLLDWAVMNDILVVGCCPRNIEIADGYVYVFISNSSVSVIRLSDGITVNTIPIEFWLSLGIGVADGYVYVTNYLGGSVSVIRLSDGIVVNTIPVGNFPWDIEIADGYAYVSNHLDNSVSVIMLSNETVIDTIPVGNFPVDIEIADGYAYVANRSGKSISVLAHTTTPNYTCQGFESPLANGTIKVKKNRAIPVKAQLSDGDLLLTDMELTSPPFIKVNYQALQKSPKKKLHIPDSTATDVTEDAYSAGAGTDENSFEYNYSDEVWQFNLKTKNFTSPGTYTITMESGDETAYTVTSCEANFVIN